MSGQCDKYGSYQSVSGHAKINHDLVLYFVGYSRKGKLELLVWVLLKSLAAWQGRPDFGFVLCIQPKYQDPIFPLFIKKIKINCMVLNNMNPFLIKFGLLKMKAVFGGWVNEQGNLQDLESQDLTLSPCSANDQLCDIRHVYNFSQHQFPPLK